MGFHIYIDWPKNKVIFGQYWYIALNKDSLFGNIEQ